MRMHPTHGGGAYPVGDAHGARAFEPAPRLRGNSDPSEIDADQHHHHHGDEFGDAENGDTARDR